MHRITTFKVIQNFGLNRSTNKVRGVLDRHRTRKEFHCLGLSQDLSFRKERYNRGRRKRLRRTSPRVRSPRPMTLANPLDELVKGKALLETNSE